MAMFFVNPPLSETDIQLLSNRIESEESAENVRFVNETEFFIHFEGNVNGERIKFSIDRSNGFIVTNE